MPQTPVSRGNGEAEPSHDLQGDFRLELRQHPQTKRFDLEGNLPKCIRIPQKVQPAQEHSEAASRHDQPQRQRGHEPK